MGRMPILILTALHHEAKAIRRGLQGIDTPVQVVVIGPGAILLSKLAKSPVCGVIMAGLAGGLAPDSATGDVVIDELSVVGKMAAEWRRGRIYSAAKIIATPELKAEIFRESGAVVVDMENEIARRVANEWGVPFLGIRTVLDRADETLDPVLLRPMDQQGRVRIGRLIGALTTNPGLLRNLLHLRNQSAIALSRLTEAVLQIIKSGWPEEQNSTGATEPL